MTISRQRKKVKNQCKAQEEAICAQADAIEPAAEDALECLRSAAQEQLRRYAGKIALALGKKAACGDLNSAKFLLQVTKEKPRPGRSRRRDGPSEAQRLAAEPLWQDPLAEPLTKIGSEGIDLES